MRLLIAIATCTLLLAGCGTNQSTPQFSGTVSVRLPSDFNAAVHCELQKTGKIDGGPYDNSTSNGWKVDIDWSQQALHDSKATYRFNWSYVVDADKPVSGSSDIIFDGANRTEIEVDDLLTISIDPCSFDEMHPDAKEAIPVAQVR